MPARCNGPKCPEATPRLHNAALLAMSANALFAGRARFRKRTYPPIEKFAKATRTRRSVTIPIVMMGLSDLVGFGGLFAGTSCELEYIVPEESGTPRLSSLCGAFYDGLACTGDAQEFRSY